MDNARNNECGCSELIAAILVNDCNSSRSAISTGDDISFSLILSLLLMLLNDHSLFCGEMRCICADWGCLSYKTDNTYKECCCINICWLKIHLNLDSTFRKPHCCQVMWNATILTVFINVCCQNVCCMICQNMYYQNEVFLNCEITDLIFSKQ